MDDIFALVALFFCILHFFFFLQEIQIRGENVARLFCYLQLSWPRLFTFLFFLC